ncbi:UNVERIFIED_CONTAM: hypothetical protein FKN15_019584 [Acipenser sinensis]
MIVTILEEIKGQERQNTLMLQALLKRQPQVEQERGSLRLDEFRFPLAIKEDIDRMERMLMDQATEKALNRVIGVLKSRFHILDGPLPLHLVKSLKDESEQRDEAMIDKIVHVCAALVNMSGGVDKAVSVYSIFFMVLAPDCPRCVDGLVLGLADVVIIDWARLSGEACVTLCEMEPVMRPTLCLCQTAHAAWSMVSLSVLVTSSSVTSSEFKNHGRLHSAKSLNVLSPTMLEPVAVSFWRNWFSSAVVDGGKVERGFSVNRQIEVESLEEKTYTAQRLGCDHLNSVGGIQNVVITKALLMSAAGARQKYHTYLDEQKRLKENERKVLKRKSLVDKNDEIKKRIEKDAHALEKSADEFALKAESTGKLTLIAKSNSMRRSVKDKLEQLGHVEEELDEKLKELKNM